MKKALKVAGLVILTMVVITLVVAIFVPRDYHLERSVTINATPDNVWPLVSSFSGQNKWSPFIKKDPAVRITYKGRDGTIGSEYLWEGNDDVGKGKQIMTRLEPVTYVGTRLIFLEPVESEAEAFIRLESVAGGTRAIWGFNSSFPYPTNAMMLFMNLEEMVGKDYEEGLVNLKRLAEQRS